VMNSQSMVILSSSKLHRDAQLVFACDI
jgi:hypothetical protein